MKIVGMGVCGPNEKYLENTLQEFKRLCDETVICLCNATPRERALVIKYGFHIVEDNREWGKYQWQIKEDLLKLHISKLSPDWVIPLDMDEVFEQRFDRSELEKLASRGGIGYHFYIVNLYDEGYSKDWSFWNIRMFRFAPEFGLDFEHKPLHPGLAPKVAYYAGNYAPFIVKHYGLKDKEDRDRKVLRYKLYDTNAKHKSKSYYDFLASTVPASPFNEDEVHGVVEKEVSTYHFKQPKANIMERNKKYVMVRNPGGKIYDIPIEHLKETLSRPGFELISEEIEKQVTVKGEVVAEVVGPSLQCQICGFTAKSEFGLKSHARKHQ